jgi:hypothetical protein
MKYNRLALFSKALQCMAIMLLFALLAVPVGFAGDEKGADGLGPIEAPPEFSSKDSEESIRNQFNLFGTIDYIDSERLVIDDCGLSIASNASISGVSKGDYVGLKINKAKEVVAAEQMPRPDES